MWILFEVLAAKFGMFIYGGVLFASNTAKSPDPCIR